MVLSRVHKHDEATAEMFLTICTEKEVGRVLSSTPLDFVDFLFYLE